MPGPGEPLWLPEDRDKAIAYEIAAREACGTCGSREQDFLDADGRPLDPPRLMAEVQDCPGCAERTKGSLDLQEDARRAAGDSENAQMIVARSLAGLSVALVPWHPPVPDDDDIT